MAREETGSSASLASRLSRLVGGAGTVRAVALLLILVVFLWLEFRSIRVDNGESKKVLEAGLALFVTNGNGSSAAAENATGSD
jgi:hypothetical protein